MRKENNNFVYLEKSDKILNLEEEYGCEEDGCQQVVNLSEEEKDFDDHNSHFNFSMKDTNREADRSKLDKTNHPIKTSKRPEKSQNNKYKDDIMHILKYAEDNNPTSLVTEICANFKWDYPDIDTIKILEDNINVYKTQIKLKSFMGEGIGITKKISRKKASVDLITKMVEDKTVRDSMRIYIDTKSITRDCKLKERDEDQIQIDEVPFEKPVYNETDDNYVRVKNIIDEYNKNKLENPLSQLDSFRNKYNIPFCFTYTIKEKIHKAVLYVGGEIFGFGVDVNIRVAKYKAAEQGMKKIKEKYGEEALKYKAVERRKSKLLLTEQKQKEEEESIAAVPCKVSGSLKKNEEIMKDVNDFFDYGDFHGEKEMTLEFFLINFERSIIPVNEYLEVHKVLALIFYSNKTLSIHFSNPTLAGSFQYDCPNSLNMSIDIILFHQIKPIEIKEAMEMLISKFKLILKDISSDFLVNITNRINSTNLDLHIRLKNKPYSFKFLIRDEEFKQFIYYLKTHNSRVSSGIKYPIVFISLRRFFRIWRRQNKLTFIKPEVLDWLIKINLKETMSSTLLIIMDKCSKCFQKFFTKCVNEVPEVIKSEVDSLSEAELEQVRNASQNFIKNVEESKLDKLIN